MTPRPSRFWDYTLAIIYAWFAVLAVLYLANVQTSAILTAVNGSPGEQAWEWAQLAGALVAFAGAVAPQGHLARGKLVEGLGAVFTATMQAGYIWTVTAAKLWPPQSTPGPQPPSVWEAVPWHTVIPLLGWVVLFAARAVWLLSSRKALIAREMTPEAIAEKGM